MSILRRFAFAALLSVAAVPVFGQNILYQHNYTGTATTPLHGLKPDIDNNGGGNRWLTRTDSLTPAGTGVIHYANGAMTAGSVYPGGNSGGQAMLGFTPESGKVYTATLRANSVTLNNASQNWLGFGFVANPTSGVGSQAQFFTDAVLFSIYRGDLATQSDGTILGPALASILDWPAAVTAGHGSAVDLQIILDTTNPAWSVQWLARAPSDPTFTLLRSEVLAVNPTIHAVGYTTNATTNVSADIEQFSLTTSGSIYKPGDVDGDGGVDLDDLTKIRTNFGLAKYSPSEGDLNNDGMVNYTDFRTWKQNSPLASSMTSVSIPEPSGLVIGMIGIAVMVYNVRRLRQA